jgi:hypothetical protein
MFKSAFTYAVLVLENVTLGARDLVDCGCLLPYQCRNTIARSCHHHQLLAMMTTKEKKWGSRCGSISSPQVCFFLPSFIYSVLTYIFK